MRTKGLWCMYMHVNRPEWEKQRERERQWKGHFTRSAVYRFGRVSLSLARQAFRGILCRLIIRNNMPARLFFRSARRSIRHLEVESKIGCVCVCGEVYIPTHTVSQTCFLAFRSSCDVLLRERERKKALIFGLLFLLVSFSRLLLLLLMMLVCELYVKHF